MESRTRRSNHKCVCVACCHHPWGATAQEHRAINRVLTALDEKHRRRLAGMLALQWGRGGIERLHELSGLSRVTIRRGRREVQQSERRAERGRVRKAGAGRRASEKNTRRSCRRWTNCWKTPLPATRSQGSGGPGKPRGS